MLNKYVWIASLVHCLFFSHVFSQECPPMIGSYHQMPRLVLTVNNNLNHSLIMMFTAPALKWYINPLEVVWVLFSVFSIFCITSLVSATPRNHRFCYNLLIVSPGSLSPKLKHPSSVHFLKKSYQRVCVDIFLSICSQIVLNLLNERMILLLRFEVAFSTCTYLKPHKLGILRKHLKVDKLITINLGVQKDTSRQLFCVL